jgi:fibro-slime domain-containing protein
MNSMTKLTPVFLLIVAGGIAGITSIATIANGRQPALNTGGIEGSSSGGSSGGGNSDPFAGLPATITLAAVVRDFRAAGSTGGHPDFEGGVGGHVVNMVQPDLNENGKPILNATSEMKAVNSQWKDSSSRPINFAHYSADSGDSKGSFKSGAGNGCVQSAQSFAQWYTDAPGVNASKNVDMMLNRVPNTNRYVFDSAKDEPYKSIGGWFPLNGELYGNYGSTGKNFHFTTEVSTEFTYVKGSAQTFTFTGDDDVWVFVGGKLVIDIGGVHGRVAQTVNLDRLSWLEDGKTYSLKIFNAERHTTESNFRIETTIRLRRVDPPATTALFD